MNGGEQVSSTEVTFDEVNTWTTISYDGPIDRVSFQGFGNGFHPYGVDNVMFTPRFECYADFTGDGTLDLFDFLAFVNAFNAEEDSADCDVDGAWTLFDFLCFTNAFNAGC